VVVNIDQLAPDEPLSPKLVGDMQAWKDSYPWLHRAFKDIGPGTQAASNSWRARIEDELKTTLDFKLRPDGTAVVWCGMSGYDFHHEPTPKELFEGLAEAYRRELKRKRSVGAPTGPGSLAHLVAPVRALPPPAEDSLTRTLATVLLSRVVGLVLIFVMMTALTFVLSDVAITVR
jgi:hypothetical protein